MLSLTKSSLDIGLVPNRVDEMKAFYGEVLGLPSLGPISLPAGTVFPFQAGDTVVKLFCVDPPPPAHPAEMLELAGIRYMTAWVDNLDDIAGRLAEHGVPTPMPLRDYGAVKVLMAADPDGNLLEFVERKEAAMPVLEPTHDFAHRVESDGAWSESYYFNAYDPPTDTGFFTRIGIRPNEGTIDVGLSVWLPGDGLTGHREVVPQAEMIDSDLRVGPVRFEMLQPGRQWRLTCAADAVAMDVTFDALTPMIGTDGQDAEGSGASAETRKSVGKGHLEQAGRWTGWLEAGGGRHEWTAARGNRDKSWGPRRWGGPKMWRWFSINFGGDVFGEGVHFGGIRIGTKEGDLHRGWVWKAGEHASIEEWKVRSEIEDDGVTHRYTHVEATDKAGRVHELDADVWRCHPGSAGIHANVPIVNEGLAKWSYEGLEGWGISEYLHQLDADKRPVVPIE